MRIVSWDPFLIKKNYWKKKFVDPVNSAYDPLVCTIRRLFCWYEQCTDRQSQKETRVSIKNKKINTGEMLDVWTHKNTIQTYTSTLVLLYLYFIRKIQRLWACFDGIMGFFSIQLNPYESG